jgi:hypothetical protein
MTLASPGRRRDVARCDLPARQCLWEHIRARALASGLKPQGDSAKLQMLCPVHGDRRRSLTISTADHDGKRLVWFCHAGCPEMAVRDALISECHIGPGCLPVSKDHTAVLLAAAIAELKAPTRDHAQKAVRALSAALGYKEIPHGSELERLAGLAGVGRRSAFRAARRGGR